MSYSNRSRSELVLFAVTCTSLLGIFVDIAGALPISGSIKVKPYYVGPVGPVAPDPNIAQDFTFSSAALGQIGISVSNLGSGEIIATDGNADGNWTSAEFLATLNTMGRVGLPAGTIVTYYVGSYVGAVAQTFSDENVGAGGVTAPGIIIQAARNNDTQAHELGHMLLDEWRWKSPEAFTAAGIHSNQANDLMATSAGGLRNIPANLAAVWPAGTTDQIRNTVGFLSTSATAIVPQTTAMYYQNSQVTITAVDKISVGVGIVDGIGGGPTVGTGPFDWGVAQTRVDAVHGKTWTVQESARTGPGGTEEYTFFFHFNTPLTGITSLELAALDIDSVGGLQITDLLSPSVSVKVYSNILTNAGEATLVEGITNDFTWGAAIDHLEHDLNSMSVFLSNPGIFAGVQDVAVSFTLQTVPEPSSMVLLAIGLVGLVWRIGGKRRNSIAGVSSATVAPRKSTFDQCSGL